MNDNYLSQSTLLYVEDDEAIRDFLSTRLSRRVKKLYTAVDGEDGYEKYCEYQPDIILTDVTMPKLNGIDMSRKIKETNKDIPIVIMSAHSDTSYLLEVIELGISGYLLKPVDKLKLFDTLESNIKTIFLEREVLEKRKQLLHQSRFALLGEMTSMIAHQWRQPLNIISMYTMGLRMKFLMGKIDLESKETRKTLPIMIVEELEKIEKQVQSLSIVIEDFAGFYKPSNEASDILLNEVVQVSVQAFKDSLKYENITVNTEYNSTKQVKIYKNEFVQICINLLNNANENLILNKGENPTINIVTDDYDGGVEVIISDNAGGILQEIMEKIFDPYFSTKVGKNGNGLGLYMSRLVIEEHLNGEITVQNENNGAKFIIRLRD